MVLNTLERAAYRIHNFSKILGNEYRRVMARRESCKPECIPQNMVLLKRVLKGKNVNWDLPIFWLGKWDFMHWDWDLSTEKQ